MTVSVECHNAEDYPRMFTHHTTFPMLSLSTAAETETEVNPYEFSNDLGVVEEVGTLDPV